MLIARHTLYLAEEIYYEITFPWLAEGETITGLDIEVEGVTHETYGQYLTIDNAIIHLDGTKVIYKAIASHRPEAGGEEYIVKFLTSTSTNQVNSDCVRYLITQEDCC